MSDLFEARRKTEDAANWRGTINVAIGEDEETQQLTVRQLPDPQFWEVMSHIDTDELESLQSDLPEDKMEEFRELQNADDLSDEEAARLEELQSEVEDEDINIFDALSYETYTGIKKAAKYGIVPDESDIQRALSEYADEIEDKYGGMKHEHAEQWARDHVVAPMVEESTNLASFAMGVKALGETLGDAGN